MVRVAAFVLTLIAIASPSFAQEPQEKRPALLIPLYTVNVALQGADVHSTMQALKLGNREGNPLFREGVSGKMVGAKLAASATTILVSEKLWKRHRMGAVSVMLVSNAALAFIAARNYDIANRSR